MITLPVNRMVIARDGTYAAEYIGHRFGGNVDVVVSRTPHDARFGRTYLMVRLAGGQWRHVAGRWPDLDQAVRCGSQELRYAVADHGVLAVAELAGAAGWTAGYGPSPSGAALAFNATLLLILAGVRS